MAKRYGVHLTAEERERLLEITRSHRDDKRTITRARILLMAHDGAPDVRIAQALKVAASTVGRVRKQFIEDGVDGAISGRLSRKRQPRPDDQQQASAEGLACIEPPPVCSIRTLGEGDMRDPGPAEIPGDFRLTAPSCGVQWSGTIDANAEKSWFTFNWPVAWQVLWTVMPSTLGTGAPQLTWEVNLERASTDFVTYWIKVKNLTPVPVIFECRYAILSKH